MRYRTETTLRLVMLIAGAVAPQAAANIIDVPADQPTIQAGIDAATGGDEVVVAPGTYAEIIDLDGKAITLRSSGGAAVTIIDATTVADPGTGKPVVRIDTGEGADTVLEGFTITGGTGDTAAFGVTLGGGIWVSGATPTIRDCVTEFNAADSGGGVCVNQGTPTFDGCTIRDNTATPGEGGGLYLFNNSGVTMTGCSVTGNDASGAAGGMSIDGATGTVVITDSVFEGNTAGSTGGAIRANLSGSFTVERCESGATRPGTFPVGQFSSPVVRRPRASRTAPSSRTHCSMAVAARSRRRRAQQPSQTAPSRATPRALAARSSSRAATRS